MMRSSSPNPHWLPALRRIAGVLAMPRYFFDVHDGKAIIDDVGVELTNADAARQQVWDTLPALAAHREADGNMACQFRIDVRDDIGRHVFHAALAMVIEPGSNG
jgi:hypothetical protein